MMTLPTGNNQSGAERRAAFTLVELILVMAMLAVVFGLAAPTLARFFRGRAITAEAARFLALTRYGQSQAVSAGVPMILWINRTEGSYGLREESGFVSNVQPSLMSNREQDTFTEEKPLQFQLAGDLRFEMMSLEGITNGVATIRFSPDGSIDETSLPVLLIRDKEDEIIPIIQSRNRLKYEIANPTNQWADAYP
ncbi:MAG: prepilin-type N-terminal cleavage/methylation domain-containing protein, partial [Chloroflexi bacterium]|nr:prepilin-type N-terminal cleavage/methylation domain-containing protein [Chloroflexota bacterium]